MNLYSSCANSLPHTKANGGILLKIQIHWSHCSAQNHVINGNLVMMDRLCVQGVYTCTSTHAQSCLTLCDLRDHSLPGSSVHGIFKVRIGLPFSSPGDLSDPGIEPGSPGPPAIHQGNCHSTSWICWRINELLHAKYLKMYLMHRKHRINILLDSVLLTMTPA